jgi:hypothetical protein
MKSVALALVLAALLTVALALPSLLPAPLLLAPAAVAAGVLAACAAHGSFGWLPVVFGSLSPLALAWIGPWSESGALVTLCAAWVAPRLWLARTRRDLVLLGAASAAAALLAGLVAARYAGDAWLTHLAANVFAGAALALPSTVVRSDTPVAHALSVAARALEAPLRATLEEAADAHRQRAALPGPGPNRTGWRELVRAADRRVALNGLAGEQAARARDDADRQIVQLVERLLGRGPAPGARAHDAPQAEPEKPAVDGERDKSDSAADTSVSLSSAAPASAEIG